MANAYGRAWHSAASQATSKPSAQAARQKQRSLAAHEAQAAHRRLPCSRTPDRGVSRRARRLSPSTASPSASSPRAEADQRFCPSRRARTSRRRTSGSPGWKDRQAITIQYMSVRRGPKIRLQSQELKHRHCRASGARSTRAPFSRGNGFEINGSWVARRRSDGQLRSEPAAPCGSTD